MNWTIIIIETVIMTIAFTAMILIPLVKNPKMEGCASLDRRCKSSENSPIISNFAT